MQSKIRIALTTIVAFSLFFITTLYVNYENGYYWSDYNYYQFILKTAREAFLENPCQAMLLVGYSTTMLYNFIFTLPLLPTALIFGDSRVIFILSQVVLFQLPSAVLLAILVSKTLKTPSKKMFWFSLFIFFLQPALWAASLRGYPDYLSFFCILLSYYFCLKAQKTDGKKNLILSGVFLALAPLIRRHYVYAAIAAATTYPFLLGASINKKELPVKSLVIIAGTSLILLFTVGILFVLSIFSEPFLKLYQTACVSPIELAGYFISGFGIVPWILAIAGIALALKSTEFERKHLINLFLFSLFMVFDWIFLGKHLAIHYLLYAAPFIVLGISALAYSLVKLPVRFVTVSLLTIFSLSNFVIGMLPYPMLPDGFTRYGMLTVPLNQPNTIGRLFSANFGPIMRGDRANMEDLVTRLQKLDAEPIFIASGNGILCPDILRNCQREMETESENEILKYIEPPILNSRDALPLGALLTANSVVIARPFMPMYKPEHSTILGCVLDCFEKKWPISEDFELQSAKAGLDEGTEISIYKRIKKTTPESAVKALTAMKKAISPDPIYGQPDWISSGELYEPTGKENQLNYALEGSDKDIGAKFILSSVPYQDKHSISGKVDSEKSPMTIIRIELYDENGNNLFNSGAQPADKSFSVALPKLDKPYYVVIHVGSQGNKITLSNIHLE